MFYVFFSQIPRILMLFSLADTTDFYDFLLRISQMYRLFAWNNPSLLGALSRVLFLCLCVFA